MADDMDHAQALSEQHLARSLAATRAPFIVGEPGECDGCFEDSLRLVPVAGLNLCARCRDKRDRRR